MRSFLLILTLCLSLPAIAAEEGAPRFTVVTAMEGKDLVTGRKITIPPGRGYKFTIADAGTLRPYMKVYDANGLEVQAYFPLVSLVKAMTPEEKAAYEEKKKAKEKAKEAAAKNELKLEINSGLEATAKGAVVAKEGCCEVDGKKKAEPEEVAPAEVAEEEPAPVEEVAQPSNAGEVLEIESPPEDFYDLNPRHAEAEEPAPEKEEEKKPEVKIAEVEATENSDYEPEPAVIPAEKPKKDEKRSPALQRPEPEPETYVKLPERGPIPKFRPDRKNALDTASAPRTRGMMGDGDAEDKRIEEEDKQPRKPASQFICRAYDAFKKKGVPDAPLRQALLFLEKNKEKFSAQRYMSIADYSQSSTKKRFYVLDLKTLSVIREKVSHGAGRKDSGDPNHDGMLNSCGGSGSERTRGGFFSVGDYYFSQKGRYKWPMLTKKPARNGMRLKGLTPGVNASVMDDGYVMHEAKYNSGGGAIMGRSDGCPAFVKGRGAPILAKLQGGSLQYHFTPQCQEHHKRAVNQVRGWENFCK